MAYQTDRPPALNATIPQDISNPEKDDSKYGKQTGETMKALVWLGTEKVALDIVPKPKIIGDRDVIVAVTGTTICGSDLHLYHNTVPGLEKGDILGHEFCGVIDELGPGVQGLKKGQRVVASFQIACGDCEFCNKGLSSQCAKTNANPTMKSLYGSTTGAFFGYSHITGGFAGGQAEYVRVPYGDVNLLPLPADVPDEKALFLSDVLCTAWHAVVDTGVQKGDVVAIWGAGPIGQMAADFSFYHGASRVILIDGKNGAWRLDYVKEKLPKVETLDYSSLPRGETVPQALWRTVPNGIDVALECAAGEYEKSWIHWAERRVGAENDSSDILNEMIESVKSFGRIGVSGVYVGYTNHFNIGSIMQRGIRLIGNGQSPVHKYWKHLLELIGKREIDPLRMVSTRAKIDELPRLYELFNKREGLQKLFIDTRFSFPPCEDVPTVATVTV